MVDLFGNPEDRFSHDKAQFIYNCLFEIAFLDLEKTYLAKSKSSREVFQQDFDKQVRRKAMKTTRFSFLPTPKLQRGRSVRIEIVSKKKTGFLHMRKQRRRSASR